MITTREADDFYRMDSIPTTPRWDTAILCAHEFLMRNGIKSLPVDPAELYKRHNWILYDCKTAEELTGEADPLGIHKVDAKTYFDGTTYVTLYNCHHLKNRIRFTLMHEIGHICLGHFNFEETLICTGGLCETDHKLLDSEANAFAAEVLAPLVVLKKLGLNDAQSIKDTASISAQAAHNRLKAMGKQIKNSAMTEVFLLKQFGNYIKKQAPAGSLSRL